MTDYYLHARACGFINQIYCEFYVNGKQQKRMKNTRARKFKNEKEGFVEERSQPPEE